MQRIKVWISGKFVDMDKAAVSVSDRGYLYGDGVFETMRSYAGIVFKLDEHVDRLYGALKVVGIVPFYTKSYLKYAINKSLKINGLKSAYMRLSMTRGGDCFGLDVKGALKPNTVIATKILDEYPERAYSRGINVKLIKLTRQDEYSPLSGIKSLNFLNHIIARLDAKRGNYGEGILMNTDGYIAEGTTSNIFLVKNGRLMTPSLDSGILPGITRSVIIDIAKRLKIGVREKRVTRAELRSADEAFLTNSIGEVLPVTRVDSKNVSDGMPGDITKLLHISYQKEVIREVMR